MEIVLLQLIALVHQMHSTDSCTDNAETYTCTCTYT